MACGLVSRSSLPMDSGFYDRDRELTARFCPNIHINKVPSLVPRGATLGAILRSARCHNLHQFASKLAQNGRW